MEADPVVDDADAATRIVELIHSTSGRKGSNPSIDLPVDVADDRSAAGTKRTS